MAEEMSQEEVSPIEIVIRSTYQTEDLKIGCPSDWSIHRLKEKIHELSPNHPEVSSQRLIFSGRVLQDSMILKDVILQRSVVDGAQVFHLVFTQPYNVASSDNVRRRNVTNDPSPITVTAPQQPPDRVEWNVWQQMWPEVVNGTANEAQLQAYHEYIQNYYQQYAAYYQSYYGYQQTFQPGTFIAGTHFTFHNIRMNQDLDNRAAAGGNAPAGGIGENIRAGLAGVDYLEVFHRLFKIVVFFSALLLYSSFERFVLVLMAALFLYFIQLRRNQLRHRAGAQRRNRRRENAAGGDANPIGNPEGFVNNNNAGESEVERNVPENGEDSAENAPPVPPPSGVSVFFATCYSFITSFFASLVPDNPVPLDMN